MARKFVVTRKFVKQWCAALRSGDIKQAKGMLSSARGTSMCCLGVACNIINPNIWETFRGTFFNGSQTVPAIRRSWGGGLEYGQRTLGMPPKEIVDAFQRVGIVCVDLSTMNDQGRSFDEIADRIELMYAQGAE